ncbi:MAG: DUF4102 domain-containing protein, partial [Proteobacteria bacterium]|nr:DUF4102 domain-containing protein [Pseudomonadota bacterium]
MDSDKNPGHAPLRRTTTKPLTAVAIAGMRPGAVLADGGIPPGAGRLKVRKRPTAAGAVTEWLFQYFRDSRSVRLSIGRYSATGTGGLSLAMARERAGELQALIRAGTDPATAIELGRQKTRDAQHAAAQASREARQKTLAALLVAYVDDLRARG